MARVIYSFKLDSETNKIDSVFIQPIKLNLQKYNYYLKLLSVTFSNVFANVLFNLEVDGIVFATPGIYTIDDLIKAYNEKANKGVMGINMNTGRLWIKNDTAVNMTITSSNFLQSSLGGLFTLPATIAPDGVINSTSIPMISTYNSFILTSQSIHNNSYTNVNDKLVMRPTNFLYSFPSTIDPFRTKNFVSVQPIEFEIQQQQINKLDFELRDGNDNDLSSVIVGNTDFSVMGQIIEIEK